MAARASVYGRQSSNKAKSIEEQLTAGHQAIRQNAWIHTGDYSDGKSASRHKAKKRDEWDRVLKDLANNVFDIIVLWESSRGDRTLSSWAIFLDECRIHHIKIFVIIDDHLYDLDRPRDWKTLATAGVDASYETDMLSIRTRRGHAGAAAAGVPAGGPTPYGYRRTFDPDTGKRIGQFPVEEQAEIVRELFRRVGYGDTILGLAKELNRRGVARPSGTLWDPGNIRSIIRNRCYLGLRIHKGEEHPGIWPALIGEKEFYTAQRILDNPGRRTTRPGRQKYLLSYLATCGQCGDLVNHVLGSYQCRKGCVSSRVGPLDEVVEDVLLGWLAGPNAPSIQSIGGTSEAEEAQVEAAKLRSQLDEWRQSAARGETSPSSLAVIERELKAKIEVADLRSKVDHWPGLLQEMLTPGADIRARWRGASIPSRRTVIKAMCTVVIGLSVPGRRPTPATAKALTLARLGESRWITGVRWADLMGPGPFTVG